MKRKEEIGAKSRGQRAKSRGQRAKSRGQRAKSKEQRAKSKEQRAESKEQRAESKVLLKGDKQQVACNQQLSNIDNSTVCLSSPLDPPEVNSGQALKGATQISVEMSGSVCGISPLGVRGNAGFGMTTMHECENPEPKTGNRSLVTGHRSFVTCNLYPGTITPEPETNGNSTVFQIIKPSAMRTIFLAEGRISESRAIRACLTIRFLTISLTNVRIEERQTSEFERKETNAVKPKVINSNKFQQKGLVKK